MQFHSLAFAVFLAVVLPLYLVLAGPRRLRAQNILLLVASYAFYSFWDWRFLGLLVASTVIDYAVSTAMARQDGESGRDRWVDPLLVAVRGSRKALLMVSLVANLGILGVFKYYDFFVTSAEALLGSLGLHPNLPLLQVVLPVGISFYTFQTIAYTYSVYRREIRATRDPIAFAVYVAYFPQLVAGPIERAQRLLPQIEAPRRVTGAQFRSGCQLALLGLFKKVAIADAVASYVAAVYSDPTACSSTTLVMGTYLFALQIYGDFSGYTDIARGVSRMFGIELMLNFRQPYLAANITDFWRRWHISLSSWLREHLYIPLGGNRRGRARTYRNLMWTMLLGGLWHGAGWNFVIWGGLHGCYLAVHKFWSARSRGAEEATIGPLRRLVGIVCTFQLVCLAWVFFRAASETERGGLRVAGEVLAGIGAGDWALSGQVPPAAMLLLPVMVWVDYLCVSRGRPLPVDERTPDFLRGLAYGCAVVMILLANSSAEVPFLYFQF